VSQLSEAELTAVRNELARAEIRDAMFRYCRGVDRADAALMGSAYHPDAHDRHGKWDGPSSGFVEAHVQRMPTAAEGIQHLLGNMLIELDGDAAHVETYFITAYRPKAAVEEVAMFGGRYLDRFERRDGEWRIAHRHVVYDWGRIEPATQGWWDTLPGNWTFGSRDRDDPDYTEGPWPWPRPQESA
jgi:hypothetical protein